MKNFNFNFKSIVQSKARWLLTIIAIITLGVGQMWGNSGGFYNVSMSYKVGSADWAWIEDSDNGTGQSVDLGTLSSGTIKVGDVYLKCWDDWGDGNFKSGGGQMCYTNKGGSTQYLTGFTRSTKSGNNYDYHKTSCDLTIASATDASGSYALVCWYQTWGANNDNTDYGGSLWGDKYFPTSSGNYTLNYKIAPPAVSGFTITPSGAGYVSGTGTSEDPYIMKHDEGNLVLTISGSQAHSDANSSAKYYTGSDWGNTASKTIYYASGSTTKQSITLKMKYNNSTASLDGAVSSITVYYQRESTNTVSASASPATGGTVTPSSSTTTGQKSGIAINATKNTGYNFSGWSIVSGSGSFVSSTSTASNRFKPTSNTSLRATFTAKNYTVRLDKNSGDSDGTVQTTYNSTSTSSFSGASRAGYSCDGYFTAKTSGSKILNSDGTLVSSTVANYLSSGYWVGDTVTVLYAHWTEDVTNYTVTYGVKSDQTSLGTLSCAKTVGGAAVSSGDEVASGTGVTFTAAPITGYEVDAWCSDAACNTPIAGAGYANTYSATVNANTQVYVKFKKKIYTITYSPSSAPTGCTYTTKPTTGTYGNTVTMKFTPSTGYTVSVSARDASSNVVTVTPGANNQYTFTQPASAVTVTVTATETMRDITIVGGTTSSTTAGVATTGSATAATPAAGKKFTGWDLGDGVTLSGCVATDRTITFNASANSSVTATYADRASVKLYFPKPSGWSKVHAYAWKESGTANDDWPGVEMTSYETVGCVNYYYYLYYTEGDGIGGAATGSDTWDQVIFSNNGATQTADLAISNGHYYYKADAAASSGRASALASAWLVKGSFNSWGETDALTPNCGANSASKSITLTAGNKTFKIYNAVNDQWWRVTGNISATTAATTMNNGDGDMTLTPSVAGPYTFTVGSTNSTPTLAVTYPTSYTVQLEVGTVKGNKYDPIIYLGSVAPANVISSGSKVLAGSKVIFAISNDAADVAKPGYNWWGFYDNAAGNDPTKYTNANVSVHTINSIAADAHVYAVFGENNYTVKMYNNGNGDVYEGGSIVTSTTAHVATASNTLTATPQTGYYFTGWDQFSDSLTISSPSTAATTIKIKNTKLGNNARLRANYSPRWSVLGTDEFGGWSAYSTNLFTGYTKVSTKDVGYNTITLAANTNYEIKVYDRENSTWYGGSANQDITYATSGSGNEYTIATTASPKSVFIQSAAGGSYTLNWNLTDKKIAVVYPTSWYITTGVNDALGGSFTAVDNSSNNVYGGKFVANNATVTFTATPNTGYNFVGWYSDASCETAYVHNGSTVVINDAAKTLTLSSITANKTVYAKFTPKTYTITLTRSGDGYGSGGDVTATATFNTTLPAVTLPTAANGYAFMGYYTGENGTGTQFMNASGTWATGVTDTISSSKWVLDAGATLYAYFKKAEVTGITFSAAIVAPSTSITATPTISPTPTGTTTVCWELQYSNGTRHPSQPAFTPGVGNAVSFTAPAASATYKLQATLKTGNNCGSGTELSVYSTTFQVAGEHTVTVRYQDADGRTLKASTEITGRPLAWTTLGDITPPAITGYTFARWDAGDGVTIKNGESDPVTTTTTSSIQIKAVYDGTLTAVYNKKNMIFFYNTLGWNDVYVYFYNTNEYWDNTYGSGALKTQQFNGDHKPYWEEEHGHMTQIEGTDIWYFDYTAAGYSTRANVVFTKDNKHNTQWFYQTKAVRRSDHSASLPMFVPLADQTPDTKNQTGYYNNGYWMNYPENSGYTLKIYNAWDATKETAAVREFAFPYSGDLIMPLKLDVEFNEANHDYWFMVYRNDGTYLGSEYHFKQGYQNEQTITGGNTKNKITTSAPGNYTLTLTYHDNGSGTVNYYIDVDFPIATGDYRIYYSDNATWSKGAHTKDSWCHPSHSIGKATDAKKDTVSFFIPKGVGISHTMKFQKASVTNEGVVTWADVAGGGITIPSSVTETGIYNFIVSQPAGGASISLEKVEPYTGNFYIRTDCAGNTKWDSFKNLDHQMTYSDYAEDNSGYSHYYAHWVESGNNVKFCIANDYSMCISDTLTEDYGTTIANISNIGALNSASANIRFMWDQATNKISRAYISGSSNISDRFLVLEGDARMYDENGNVLTTAGGGKISGLNDYEMNLVDDQNFVYERTIQVNTTARAKLTAKYNNNVQYFKGSAGAFADGTTVELLGGSAAGKYTMRIVYDFKTNRLVTAYIPSGTIEDNLAINADLMIVREHQEAGQQLLFNGGSLSEVHTVYGVMRFNRWTLNNKEKTGGHSPVGDPKSMYERALYWISFPFDVKLSDVFGFGTYGTHWILEEYNGTKRAAEGFWADSQGFWEYVMPSQRATYELKAGKGYVLALDLDLMKDNNTEFWANNIEQVELFFPSALYVNNIEATDVTTSAASHLYDAAAHAGHTDDRTYKDSHWNMIGVPSYANYGETLTSDGSAVITWATPTNADLPYLYEWNAVDDSYTVQTGTTYPFMSMHAYMVQYHGNMYWSLASATPASPIVARRTYEETPQNVEFRLELQQNEKMADQTFVKLSNKEDVSVGFAFDEDLSKEFNKNKANIYTIVENNMPVAGNTMSLTEQTTVVPVGVIAKTNGDYTFSMPDGTAGIGVTLIDNETGIRTSLSALDYTVFLEAGTYDGRFVMEISPIVGVWTNVENVQSDDVQSTKARKVIIDQKMYIIKNGKMFDARGAVVK